LLLKAYDQLIAEGKIKPNQVLRDLIMIRRVRSQSGIVPISVLTKPWPCRGRCIYCPTETMQGGKTLMEIDLEKKGIKPELHKKYKDGDLVMPKSYISSEPGAQRALRADFDPMRQISGRLQALIRIGHLPEKCELIIQGGTFTDLPKDYRRKFVSECYQAFNETDSNKNLLEQQKLNETAKHRVIGLTVETRPDAIDEEEINFMRELGVTRVEMGVQTLDDNISKLTKRGHDTAAVIKATKLLRAAGFKIVYHIMPMLPGSNPKLDLTVYKRLWDEPDFRPDYIKIYPCSVVPFSELHDWHKQGKYRPYNQAELYELLKQMILVTPPYTRITRLIRDIPSTAIIAGNKKTNARQIIELELKNKGLVSQDIRAREIKNNQFDPEQVRLKIRHYQAGGGEEYFLEYQLPDETLLALLRLYLTDKWAIIRELHTYGNLVPIDQKTNSAQHLGFGKKLIQQAIKIAKQNNYQKLSVIAGIGVKPYYRKLDFKDDGTYLTLTF